MSKSLSHLTRWALAPVSVGGTAGSAYSLLSSPMSGAPPKGQWVLRKDPGRTYLFKPDSHRFSWGAVSRGSLGEAGPSLGLSFNYLLALPLLPPFPSCRCLSSWGFSMIPLRHFAYRGGPFSEFHRAESFSFMRCCYSSQPEISPWSHLLVASHPGHNTATGIYDYCISSATSVWFT